MLHLTDIQFSYKKGQNLFHKLSLNASPGHIYGLLGKNGAGKSTLLKIISGMVFPQVGKAEVMMHNPAKREPSFLSDIYFLSEEMYIPKVSIKQYVKMFAPFYPKFDHDKFSFYLAEFSLPADGKLNEFSFGQKKKVLISFALSTNVKLLILDEPTNGLDIPSKTDLRKLLVSSLSEDQIYFISTHQVRDLANLIDPVIILDDGDIIFNENMEDVAKKLHFEVTLRGGQDTDVLYEERVPGGYMTVKPNISGQETEVDMEALFNTVIRHKDQITTIFRKEAQNEN